MYWISKPPRFTYWAGSGRVFSGFGIWPKYGAGIGKMINILTGSGIWLFPGKQDSPKIGHGMRDLCLPVCRECRKPLKTWVNSKYQSKGSTYILHLLAFVEIRLFNVFFWERKAVFGKLMKNVGDAGFSRKRGGNAGSGPPFQTLIEKEVISPSVFYYCIWDFFPSLSQFQSICMSLVAIS